MEKHPAISDFQGKVTVRYEVFIVFHHIFRGPISLLLPYCEDLLFLRD